MSFFSFFYSLWRDSQPWGWLGVAFAYYAFIFSFFSGWLLWVLFFLNPMTVRVSFNLWRSRDDLNDAADNFASLIRAYKKDKED